MLKFEHYKNCLKINQLEKEINQLEESKLNRDNLRGNHEELKKAID